jgi:hypothetical protein
MKIGKLQKQTELLDGCRFDGMSAKAYLERQAAADMEVTSVVIGEDGARGFAYQRSPISRYSESPQSHHDSRKVVLRTRSRHQNDGSQRVAKVFSLAALLLSSTPARMSRLIIELRAGTFLV